MRSLSLLALLFTFALPAAAQDGAASLSKPCEASCQSVGSRPGAYDRCVQWACGNPFDCPKVLYISIEDYMRDRYGVSFNEQTNYFLDVSDGSRAAINAKRKQVIDDLKTLKTDLQAAEAMLAALQAGGSGVSSVSDMNKAYERYISVLRTWEGLIIKFNAASSSGIKSMPKLSNASKAQANAGQAKIPIMIDRELTKELLDIYEFCGFGGIMANKFFTNIRTHELRPGQK